MRHLLFHSRFLVKPEPQCAVHYFAQRLPRLSGRDKSGPYDSRNELLLWRFIARNVGAQFHCARFGQDETVQKSDVRTFLIADVIASREGVLYL